MTTTLQSSKDLIERILELTKSPQSIAYYRLAIQALGEELVESELGELRYQMNCGEVREPAKYFTTLLEKQLQSFPQSFPQTNKQEFVESYLSASALDFFKELRPLPILKNTEPIGETMTIPYSTKSIPWTTFIGPDFFTLTTNKAKSDRILAKFRMLGGQVVEIPLWRGKFFPKDEERGILTAEEGRILGALESIWVEQGCQYTRFSNGAVGCHCKASVRDMAKLVGWTTFGGTDLAYLKRKAVNLKVKGYYLELDAVAGFREQGLKGYGFSLVDTLETLDKQKNQMEKTTLFVRFSDPYSRQLLARRVVSRPKGMIKIRSELAFLLRLYLEPILMKRAIEGGEHRIELLNLIRVLNLPTAGWHNFKSRRRTMFEKSLNELMSVAATDGRKISLRIEQGQNQKDLMLVAQLQKTEISNKA